MSANLHDKRFANNLCYEFSLRVVHWIIGDSRNLGKVKRDARLFHYFLRNLGGISMV